MDDAELLSRLVGEVHLPHVEAHPEWFKPHVVSPELIADYQERLSDENTHIFIGEVDGDAIGFVLAEIIERPDNPYNYAMRYILVDQMSVNAAQRSNGYGAQLMNRVFELAKSLGIGRVMLTVWAFNQRAIAFYEREGFAARTLTMEANVE